MHGPKMGLLRGCGAPRGLARIAHISIKKQSKKCELLALFLIAQSGFFYIEKRRKNQKKCHFGNEFEDGKRLREAISDVFHVFLLFINHEKNVFSNTKKRKQLLIFTIDVRADCGLCHA